MSTSPTTDRGHALEWHVVLFKSIQNIAFHFVPGLHHTIVFLLSAFSLARFEPTGSVGHTMSGHGIEELLVEAVEKR